MFRDRPTLAPELLAGPLGITVPTFQHAHTSPSDLNDVMPTEYRADLVINLVNGDAVVLAVVVEAQLHTDIRKRRSWPVYVATVHSRLDCPVMLLVMSANPAVATWCATPITVGEPDFILTPQVIGPREIPIVTDPAQARRSPEVAVLSAMAHGDEGPDQKPVLEAFLTALSTLDHDHSTLYADVVLTALSAAARDYLEAIMTTTPYRYESDFARRYFDQGEAQGEARGKAQALLAVLGARGIEVPPEVHDRVANCDDLAQLDLWVTRAATATSVDELFHPCNGPTR